MAMEKVRGLGWRFVEWFVGGSGATLGYLLMLWLGKKIGL
jgi:hypothetical protein